MREQTRIDRQIGKQLLTPAKEVISQPDSSAAKNEGAMSEQINALQEDLAQARHQLEVSRVATAQANEIISEKRVTLETERKERLNESQRLLTMQGELESLRNDLGEILQVASDPETLGDVPEDDLALVGALSQAIASSRAAEALAVQRVEEVASDLTLARKHIESLLADQRVKEQAIKDLEDRIRALAPSQKPKPVDMDEIMATSPVTSTTRMSLPRSATPSNASRHPPPITPPPSLPPPPVPGTVPAVPNVPFPYASTRRPSNADKASDVRSSTSTTASDVKAALAGPTSSAGHTEGSGATPLYAQMEEQEIMIRTLNKQLLHCETDLQTVSPAVRRGSRRADQVQHRALTRFQISSRISRLPSATVSRD